MKYGVITGLVLLGLMYHNLAQAERPPIDPKRNLELVYGDRSFNSSSKKKDNLFVVLQDGDSGRTKVIKLTETENNSAIFAAIGDLADWADLEKIYPEVYVIPQSRSNSEKSRSDFERAVKLNQVSRSPVIFKEHSSGLQILDIYSSRQELVAALDNYKQNMTLTVQNEKLERKLRQELPEQDFIDKATREEKIYHLMALERKENQNQVQRLRKQQVIKQEIEQRKIKAQNKSQDTRQANIKKAADLASKALKAYSEKNYQEAKNLFDLSAKLDPSNKDHLFYFGVTLFRLKDYENAIAYLNQIKTSGGQEMEKNYFIALSLYQLQEINRALVIFRDIKSRKHPTLSPSAAFYEGLILYSQEKFVEAKIPFEFVIDNSSDPRLDEKAEMYLEDIAWKIYYKKNRLRKWLVDFGLEVMHDSNVLFATDDKTEQGKSGLANKRAGARGQLVGGVTRRLVFNESHELSGELDFNYMYSQDSIFKRADPLNIDFELPYSYKTAIIGKSAQFTVAPGAEELYMDVEDTGDRGKIQSSLTLDTNLIIATKPQWISSYSINLESTDSYLRDTADGLDDADATFVEIRTNQSFYLGKTKRRALIPGLGYINNTAKGANKTYARTDVDLTYMDSRFWKSTFFVNLHYHKLEFPNHDEKRLDDNYRLYLGLERSINDNWSWGASLNYSTNDSNVVANQYDKTVALTSINYHWEK